MPFTTALTNQTHTLNGALAYKSTGSAVLNLFGNGVSAQNKIELLTLALEEDLIFASKVAIYLRDIREGQGNRDILRELFKVLASNDKTKLMKKIAKHIPEFGRWKDLIDLIGLDKKLDEKIFKIIKKHWQSDTLLAKWLPRQGCVAKKIIRYLAVDHGFYRRTIAKLSNTVEQQMCAKQWSEIDYKSVPSQANIKYSRAFSRNDEERRAKFLEQAMSGDVTINSSTLYPHQITSKIDIYNDVNNETEDALWENLPNYMEKAVNVLPIIDVSYSMTSPAVGTSGSCMDVAIGLGLYFAEHNTGSYKDLWMNFSQEPEAYKLKGNTLSEKMKSLDYHNWGMSTNIDKAMDFILNAAKQEPESAPKMILIVSDMEFDSCITYTTNYETMLEKFKEAGVEMPKVVFWRVNVLSGSNPITQKDNAIIINGYSPSVLEYILEGNIKDYNAYEAMVSIIGDKYSWLDK